MKKAFKYIIFPFWVIACILSMLTIPVKALAAIIEGVLELPTYLIQLKGKSWWYGFRNSMKDSTLTSYWDL